LYGPVCAGNAGVGLRRLSQVMLLTTAGGLALPIGRREGRVRMRDLNAREIDSVVDAQYVLSII
jgi:hypothetical protein